MVSDLVEVVALTAEFANEFGVGGAAGEFGGCALLVGGDQAREKGGDRDATLVGFDVEAFQLVGRDASACIAGAGWFCVRNPFAISTARHVSISR